MKSNNSNTNIQMIKKKRNKVYSVGQKQKQKTFRSKDEYHDRLISSLQFRQTQYQTNLMAPRYRKNVNQQGNNKTENIKKGAYATTNIRKEPISPSMYLLKKVPLTSKSKSTSGLNLNSFRSIQYEHKFRQVKVEHEDKNRPYFKNMQLSNFKANQIRNAYTPKKVFEGIVTQKMMKRLSDHSKGSLSKDSQGSKQKRLQGTPKGSSPSRIINMNLNFNVNFTGGAEQNQKSQSYLEPPSQGLLTIKSPKVHPNTTLSAYNLKNRFFRKIDHENLNQKLRLLNEKKKQKNQNQNKKNCNSNSNPFCMQNIKVIKKIGDGHHGDIYLVKSKQNNFLFVLKCFKKQQTSLDFIIQEFKIQLYCNHPNILKGYGYHIGRTQLYLAIEPGNGNLFHEIKKNGTFSQVKTQDCIKQILNGLLYLHRNGVIHRDLKPENIIVCGQTSQIYKISDFGWSTITQTMRKTFCGTYDYVSPEVADGAYYDFKIDSWSIGIMTFELLTGKIPFDQKKIMRKQFSSLGKVPEIKNASKMCQKFVESLLAIDPQERMNIEQALDHQWINKNLDMNQGRSSRKIVYDNILNLFQ